MSVCLMVCLDSADPSGLVLSSSELSLFLVVVSTTVVGVLFI